MLQVAASAVETTGSKAALKAAFGILMTAEAPKVSFLPRNWGLRCVGHAGFTGL